MARRASSARKTSRAPRKAVAKRTAASQPKPAPPPAATPDGPRSPARRQRTYRVRQAIHVNGGRVRAGELVVLDPESGLAKSLLVTLVEDETPPAVVREAFGDAG